MREGTITSATFRIRGDLYDFPFHDPKVARDADFKIGAKFEGLTFGYIPEEAQPAAAGSAPRESWPALTRGSGELAIDRTTIDIKNAKAQLGNVEWNGIQGRIGDLPARPRLEIEGTALGPLTDMLRFVDATPVGRWTGRALAAATATGPAELKLALGVPLTRPSETVVRGSVALAGNDIRVSPDTPLLAAAKGRVDFSQRGFTISGATARTLGGDLAFEGGSSAGVNGGDSLRFSGRGTATADGLRQASELGTVARVAMIASGMTSYRATLAFVAGRPQISVATNLLGVAVDLPAPLGKTAAQPMTLRVRTVADDSAPPPDAAAGALREALQVDYGGALQAHFVREVSGDSARVVRGAIRVGEARAVSAERVADPLPGDPFELLPLPASGVAANVAVKSLDVDVWQAALSRMHGGDGGRGASGAAPLVFDASGGAGYVPDAIAVRAAELVFGSRHLANVTAGLTQQGELWRANVTADELEGYFEYRPARRASGAGRVFARLARLSLPKGEVERVESLLEEQPATIPALDIVVDDFELRGKNLGKLEIEAVNRSVANRDGVREWQLSKLNLTMPEAQLSATGTWGDAGGGTASPKRAAMNFTLTLVDSGALLERLGMGQVVRGGKGTLSGEIAWPGSPFSPDYARMTGQIKVSIDSGQFLKAGPGAARLLGVLSLQSLPRRLQFDFRDLFAEGFAFDNVTGDARVGDGRASSNNLRMRGAAAVVLMEGSADIVNETEDLRVVVVPEINAGTASLAFAVINPAIGIGTFLAQYVLRKPLIAASTREFRVSGPWDDPKVERVERNPTGEATADSAPNAEPAPAVTR